MGTLPEGWARRFFDNSPGFVESVNTKIRVIQRRVYGFRDEEYLRLKVLTCMLPEMLGHHSIQITVDTYGHLIPGANRQAVNRLGDAEWRTTGGKSATPAQPSPSRSELPEGVETGITLN